VISCVEIRFQMIQNLYKLKYNFNVFVLIFQCYSYNKEVKIQPLYYKSIGNKIILCILKIFRDEMKLGTTNILNKLTEEV
jgi:hypothetical protein